jgi:lipopolysaccharide assembly protein A
MRNVKLMFWVLMLFVIFGFTLMNIHQNVGVIINPLSSAPDYTVSLPLLVMVAFLLGLLPYFILHHVTRWHLKRKLHITQRELARSQLQAQEAAAAHAQSHPEN